MRSFLTKLGGFIAIQMVIAMLVLAAYRPNPASYMAATLDKHVRLDATPSPRIVLVGGSHVAFGTDSREIERITGLPAVNMGLHAGLGLDFILSEAEADIQAGDVVVVSPVYAAFAPTPPTVALVQLLEQRPASVRHLGWSAWAALLDHGLFSHSRVVLRTVAARLRGQPMEPRAPYRRDAFNAWGDVAAERDSGGKAPRRESLLENPAAVTPATTRATLDRLNRFAQYCRQRGASPWFAWPPAINSELDRQAGMIDAIVAAADGQLQMPQINRPGDAAFPAEMFYDTAYHLSGPGASEHSRRLAVALRDRALAASTRLAHQLPALPPATLLMASMDHR